MAGPLSERELWDRRYREGSHGVRDAPDWLEEVAALLPSSGRALDLAAGTGRVSRWLAGRGLDVLAVDVSPVGLDIARERAAADGLHIQTLALDLVQEPLPAGPWQLISCFGYLQRDLFPRFPELLAAAGVFVCGVATRRNLERHTRPPERFLLEEGELEQLVAPLEVAWQREGWHGDHALARIVARRV